MDKDKKAFTLVELLVVIAIIALLVSILLPAIGKARKQAWQAVCATNLHSIGMGTMLYAEDNQSKVPPMNNSTDFGVNGTGTQRTNMWARMIQRFDIGVDKWAPWWNTGFLYRDKYLEDGHIFYCPSKAAPFKYEDYAKPQFPTPDEYGRVRMSYYYNPVCKATNNRVRRHNKIEEFGAGILLCTDLLEKDTTKNVFAHDGPGWNTLYGDGHVEFVSDYEIEDLINDNYIAFASNDYAIFDKVLDEFSPGEKVYRYE